MIFEALIAVVVLGTATLTLNTIWSRKNTWVRGAAVATWFALAPVTVGIGMFALGHPAPNYYLLVPGGEYVVLGVKMVQFEAIYLFLDFGRDHPRYVKLPWDSETARDIQELQRAERRGDIPGFLGVFPPYEDSWDRNPPQFHPLPQPPLTIPKDHEGDPLRYERHT